MKEKDTYKTLVKTSGEVLFKEKNSKFFAIAFPVSNEKEVTEKLLQIRNKHHKAGHHCYAWQLGKEEGNYHFRANDDGEPGNSAGMPIYGQIQAFGLTNILIVVSRYFGGVKLGVGGLIQAYRSAAKMALENSRIVSETVNIRFEVSFGYPEMNSVMRIIRENDIEVISRDFGIDCRILLSVRKKDTTKTEKKFRALHRVSYKILHF